jgi:hypothetical protein
MRHASSPQQLRNDVFSDLAFAAITEVHYFHCQQFKLNASL